MRFIPTLLAAVLLAGPAFAQNAAEWAYWAGIDVLIPYEGDVSTSPAVMADRDTIHLEARWNYEGDDTGSLWIGYNFRREGELSWLITPMLGTVFGDTRGLAPGLELSACWKKLDVYVEAEHVFSTDEDFTYVWSELAASPSAWLRTGIATQWTRTADDTSVQHGPLLGIAWRRSTLTGFLFDPGSDDETVVLTAAVNF